MNYFAHGRSFVKRPYFLAGTAVPDWLGVVDRRMRVPKRLVEPFLEHRDSRIADLAAGILQHYVDDAWFHATRAFAELNWRLTQLCREALADGEGFRPSFLGHILVEIHLDGELIAEDPGALDDYYSGLATVEPEMVASAINGMATRSSDALATLVRRFCEDRFLYDYLEDAKLLERLNRVMLRVGLPLVPESFQETFPEGRRWVRERCRELLTRPGTLDAGFQAWPP